MGTQSGRSAAEPSASASHSASGSASAAGFGDGGSAAEASGAFGDRLERAATSPGTKPED